MKKLNQLLALTFLVATVFGCSGDDDNPIAVPPVLFQEENPLQGYITTTGYNTIYTYTDDNNYYEMGYTFTPLVKGKINAIVITVPVAVHDIRVTIWDVATATAIRTETVDILNAATRNTIAITPLNLEKDKLYGISMNTRDYYFRTDSELPEGYSDPIIVGNISFRGPFIYMGSTTENQDFSQIVNGSFGDCSMNFQQTE